MSIPNRHQLDSFNSPFRLRFFRSEDDRTIKLLCVIHEYYLIDGYSENVEGDDGSWPSE